MEHECRRIIPVKQEDAFGCGVACVACVLGISYQDALILFKDGEKRAKYVPNFYCNEIVSILNDFEERYTWKRISNHDNVPLHDKSIVFIEKSAKYNFGHFLTRIENFWMDPWINFPDLNRIAGLREKLPGKPTYVVYKM